MRIEEEATLKSVLKSGVSLFLGAGFSVLSKDIDKKTYQLEISYSKN